MQKVSKIIGILIITLSLLLLFSAIWVKKTFGLINLDSLIFHFNVPLKGAERGMIISYVYYVIPRIIVLLIILFFIPKLILKLKYRFVIIYNFFNKNKEEIYLADLIKKYKVLLLIILFISVIIYVLNSFKVLEYFRLINQDSGFIEENYVYPENTNIEFSEKRNLIHIFLESMEFTYASTSEGGAFENNLIPNLTNYAKKETSFKNSYGGGFYNSRATGWTIAGMVAQTAGIGFLVPGDGNEYGNYSKFLPGAYSLGEILDKRGYNQVLLIGSDGNFAGRNDYFMQHGNYIIKDYNYAQGKGLIDNDYYVWWGYEDSKLFEFAKNELTELASKNEPFNLTMLTTNTHHIGGYLEEDCDKKYDSKFKNVILCSDNQVKEFIEWIKKQSFYKNTTIVITGDHLSMDPTFFNDIGEYERTNYNVFINPVKKANNTKDRLFNTLDIYPTIIGSLGGNIEGNRLGLGTDLFSDTKTLYEEYGKEYVDNEFAKNSSFFKQHIVYGK